MKKEKVVTRLKFYRTSVNHMTQQELADQVGISRQSINAIEKGKFLPSIESSLKLARFFGIAVEKLFYLETEE
ncbi:helix-turn-helix transcriptional regulator [Enterococcus sp. AZ196]|uniref:helix-turn-helix transcriptional regulator n=1 Tax=Enterococcus sp. AZ196 TaxID=2774659 RepID=UPI003D27E267